MSSSSRGPCSSGIRKDISNHCFILGIPDLQRSQYVVDGVDWILQDYASRNKWTDLWEIPLCILHSACLEIMSAHDHYLMNVDIPSWAEFIEVRESCTRGSDPFRLDSE